MVVAVAAFLAQLDVNQYKAEILEFVAARSGRPVSITGDIGFKFTWVPTILVNGIAFGNAPWAAHKSMATADRVEAQVEILALLGGRLSLKKLNIAGARISLETDRKGLGNWIIDGDDEAPEFDGWTSSPRFDFRFYR